MEKLGSKTNTSDDSGTPSVHQRRKVSVYSSEEKTHQAETISKSKTVHVVEETWNTTVHWNDLPHWLQDNQHILTGYRPASDSFIKSFLSLAYIHNETVNIYSHLLPCLITLPFSIILHKAVADRYETASSADIAAFGCFFGGAAFCLAMSSLYHTISNHSPMVAYISNACDYLGIVGLITGSFIPSVYYGFYCMPQLQRLYWAMISSLGLGCAIVSTIPRFRTPPWRPFRAGMFISLGLSAVIPVIHGIIVFGFDRLRREMGLDWAVLQGFLYILGAGIYAARIPERLRPGKFDILGHSHQIFHVLVVLAACAHLKGLLEAFDYRHSGQAMACR